MTGEGCLKNSGGQPKFSVAMRFKAKLRRDYTRGSDPQISPLQSKHMRKHVFINSPKMGVKLSQQKHTRTGSEKHSENPKCK